MQNTKCKIKVNAKCKIRNEGGVAAHYFAFSCERWPGECIIENLMNVKKPSALLGFFLLILDFWLIK